ncbi:protein PLASTID MOVEMENT IMPAIRED 1 [Iris pallida]|uniref:Protein PLASTID MOVEMENT IMPAIRED 1 n=1 Tax=Iris pallida TaxID=29817 RepID=A0AAX6DT79_IRIPA|nr:protein PLASTID MOVEMENT IMPAIRED 1 [Iris pallida]
MEDGGVGIYNQAAEGTTKESRGKGPAHPSSPMARGQSKSSFSVSSPKITRAQPPVTPSNSAMDLKGIDDFNLDEPAPPPPPGPSSSSSSIQKVEPESKTDELDLPEFDVIDRGVEIEEKDKKDEEAAETEEAADESSASSEVVKEVVHDSAHRMTELDAIANQIKALELMVIGDENEKDPSKPEQEDSNQQLDAEEETVTKEFLQMLELEADNDLSFDMPQLASETNYVGAQEGADGETKSFLSDLGKGLGPVVQTRDGGYLASTNPLDLQVARKDTPKLAMQLSKPVILRDQKLTSGVEVFQKLAAVGMEELGTKLASLASMDELTGKTAEQIAFEGMASVIISRRAKEGASSSAARSVAALKTMAAAMNDGRRERIATGIWNVKEEPVAAEEILPFALQKIEVMAVEALKIQAEVEEEEAPFDVSLPVGKDQGILDSVALPEEWERCCEGANGVTMLVVVQLRDPLRRNEAVGAPVIAVVQAAGAGEGRFKVTSLHAGGMRIRSGGGGTKSSSWDGEKQRLTAMQWLVAYGLAKAGKTKKKTRLPRRRGAAAGTWFGACLRE